MRINIEITRHHLHVGVGAMEVVLHPDDEETIPLDRVSVDIQFGNWRYPMVSLWRELRGVHLSRPTRHMPGWVERDFIDGHVVPPVRV